MTVRFVRGRGWQTEQTGQTNIEYTTSATGGTHVRVTYVVDGYDGLADEWESPVARSRRLMRAMQIALWTARRRDESWRSIRERPPPRATPPKARTEWGMVHRARCVHRMGQN